MTPKLRVIKQHHRCAHCLFRRFFVNVGLDCHEIDRTGQTTTVNIGPFKPGEYLYRAGDACNALYVVHAGSVKTETVTLEGDLHISGFYLTGELFGADGIHQRRYVSDAVAIERTWVCELTFDNWARLCEAHPALQGELVSELGRFIAHKEHEALASHYHRLEHRLMSFLIDLLQRMQERQSQVSSEIALSMTKTDIGRYLGATPESISRSLARLEQQGYIINTKRRIRILRQPQEMNAAV